MQWIVHAFEEDCIKNIPEVTLAKKIVHRPNQWFCPVERF